MKKALTVLLAALLLCLCSCTPLTEADPPAESLDVSEESVASAVGEESEESDFSSEETSDDSENEVLCEEVRTLIELDSRVIDIFANGELFSYSVDYSETDTSVGAVSSMYVAVPSVSQYAYYGDVVSLLSSVYTDDSTAIDVYLYNSSGYGPTVLRSGLEGRTEVCFVYNADYRLDTASAEIRYVGCEGETHKFSYNDGTHTLTVCATETADGLRLTNSLYLLEQERQSELPWVKDTASERSGSCSTLEGSCLIINVFANDSDSAWTESAKLEVLAMLDEGLEFIKNSAAEYGVTELEFVSVNVDMDVGADAMDHTVGGSYALYAFDGTGYDGIGDFMRSHNADTDYDNACTIFHFNKHGRSYFVPCTEDYSVGNDWYYEYGVLFYSKQEQGEYFSCPSVYAHELLHAFGAKDLYSGTVTEGSDALAALLFDGDIMRYEPTEIALCYIGPLTAKLIGWRQSLDDRLRAVLNGCLN